MATNASSADETAEAKQKFLRSPGSKAKRDAPFVQVQQPSGHNLNRQHFDINLYATKKSAAQGLLDLALLMANASQLKHILMTENHRFYTAMLVLLITSIVLQIVVGVALLCLAKIRLFDYGIYGERRLLHLHQQQFQADGVQQKRAAAKLEVEDLEQQQQDKEGEKKYDERMERRLHRADVLNNFIVAGIFILTVINVFISAFGLNESMPHKGN